MNRVQVKT